MKTGRYHCPYGPEALKNLRSHTKPNCFYRLEVNQHYAHHCRYPEGHKGVCRCISRECGAAWKKPTPPASRESGDKA